MNLALRNCNWKYLMKSLDRLECVILNQELLELLRGLLALWVSLLYVNSWSKSSNSPREGHKMAVHWLRNPYGTEIYMPYTWVLKNKNFRELNMFKKILSYFQEVLEKVKTFWRDWKIQISRNSFSLQIISNF